MHTNNEKYREYLNEKIARHLELLGPKRQGAFEFLMNELASLNRRFFIVETGCARIPNNYAGDGQSTFFWELLCQKYDSSFFSVDIDQRAVGFSGQNILRGQVVFGDSVHILRHEMVKAEEIDLLYLDSYDWVEGKIDSQVHHLAELASVYCRLPSGCLIAVDDCHADDKGKHVEIEAFMTRRGVAPIFRSYVTVWRKP